MEDFLEAILWRIPKQNTKTFPFLFFYSGIDSALKKFTGTLLQAAESMMRTIWFDTGHGRDTNRWYDRDCFRKKHEVRRTLNRFQTDADKATYREKRSEHKPTISKKKKQYKITIHQSLLDNKTEQQQVLGNRSQCETKKKETTANQY